MNTRHQPKVFVSRVIPSTGLDQIQKVCNTDVWPDALPPTRAELLRRVSGCEAVLTLLTELVDDEFFDAAGPQLKVVSNYAVGFNNIDIDQATRRGIRVGNTPDVLTEATADMAFSLLIAASRRIVEAADYVRAGKWQTWEPLGHIGLDLSKKTIGIVGMGRIGYAMAKKCQGGWDMSVLYCDKLRNERAEGQLGARQVDLETLLAQSDFVSAHVNLDEATVGMFDAPTFRKMKPTTVFINTARGALHNQSDLYAALSNHEIFAAGLDVTDPEPIAADDPLLRLPNCVIVPHIASATVSSRNRMSQIAAKNILAGLEGKLLLCCVNPEVEDQ